MFLKFLSIDTIFLIVSNNYYVVVLDDLVGPPTP